MRESLASRTASTSILHLAKAYADIGQHARSFEYLLRGNARKRKLLIYDEAAGLGELERIARVFAKTRA
jgi:hypothetical protein